MGMREDLGFDQFLLRRPPPLQLVTLGYILSEIRLIEAGAQVSGEERLVLQGTRYDHDWEVWKELALDPAGELGAARQPAGQYHDVDRALDRGQLHDRPGYVPREKVYDHLYLITLPGNGPRVPEMNECPEIVRSGQIYEPTLPIEVLAQFGKADLSFIYSIEQTVERDVAAPVRARHAREGVDEIDDIAPAVPQDRYAPAEMGTDRHELVLGAAEDRSDEPMNRLLVQVVRARTVPQNPLDPRHARYRFHLVRRDRIGRRDEQFTAAAETLGELQPDRYRHIRGVDDPGLFEILDHLLAHLVGARRDGLEESAAARDTGEIALPDTLLLHPLDYGRRPALYAVRVVGREMNLFGRIELESAV